MHLPNSTKVTDLVILEPTTSHFMGDYSPHYF